MEYNNIKEMLVGVSNKYPDKIAITGINNNKELFYKTYKDLLNEIYALGTALYSLNIDIKRTVIIGKNSYEWALSFLTSMCSNGITIPLDKELSDKELMNCINRIEADTIIYSKEFESRIKNMSDDICTTNYISMDKSSEYNIYDLIELGKKMIQSGNKKYINNVVDSNKVSELLFTSGTTSESKIVMLSHSNIMSDVNIAKQVIDINENDVLLSVLPLHHTFENTCGLIGPLCSGSNIAYNDELRNVSKNLKRMKPTMVLVVPRFMELFEYQIKKEIEKQGKDDLVNKIVNISSKINIGNNLKKKIFKDIHEGFGGNIKVFIVGGAAANPEISKFMRGLGFRVIQGYGLTECSPMVCLNAIEDFRDNSVGKALPKTDVVINNPNEDGIGEIKVKGPQVMLGYYKNEKATKEVIKEDGYFYTGDLGSIDKKGFVRVKGRCKNLIVTSNGKNIYPEEIEEVVNNNELIKESLLYDKEMNNGRNVLSIDIVLNDEITKRIKENPTCKEEIKEVIKEYLNSLNETLPEYKRISNFEIKDKEFDKTTTLKIKRYKVNNK